jgi:DNA-binding transcriptional ArsR family regulator
MLPQKHIEVIDEPEKLQMLLDETRRNIIYTLRKATKSVSQLARELRKTPPTIHYHIKKLETAGFVELARTQVVNNNLTEKYYKLSITPCIIGFDFSGIERHGLVPPTSFQKKRHTLDDESVNHLLSQLGVTVHSRRKAKLRKCMRTLFDNAATNAEQVFDDITSQIELDMSNHDKYKLRKVVSVIPMATVCCMLGELQSRQALTVLIKEISKLYKAKIERAPAQAF